MFPGPVFHAELITTARRARYYAVRFAYGLILLFFIMLNAPELRPREIARLRTIDEMARTGRAFFMTFLWVQSAAVLIVCPALIAGTIAEEKQRKTIGYLLASRLSSFEIVVGKLGARLHHVAVFLAIGLPVTSLMSLFGGVEPAAVLLVFAATVTTAFFLSALAILVSVHARRAREAIAQVYVLEIAWLLLPPLIPIMMPRGGPWWVWAYEWVKPVNDWIVATNPLALLTGMSRLGSAAAAMRSLGWLMGLQVAYGIAFVLIAVARLRPVCRAQGGGDRHLAWLSAASRGRRILPRPPCGDDAMMWKERYVSRTSVATKVASALVAGATLAGLGYLTYLYAEPAFRELAEYGYGGPGILTARAEFAGYLRVLCTTLYLLWALGIASASSASMTSEREEDTWTSLVATPLDGAEVVRAKMFGAVWGLRWVGLVLATLWLIGLAAGAIHPFGFAAVVVETAAFAWFATALGTAVSLRSRNSGRALLATLGILIFVNGGYLMCCIPLRPRAWLAWFGMTPMIEAISLLNYEEVRWFFSSYARPGSALDAILACVVSVAAHALAALALTRHAFDRFDDVVDRPRWSGADSPPSAIESLDVEDEGDGFDPPPGVMTETL